MIQLRRWRILAVAALVVGAVLLSSTVVLAVRAQPQGAGTPTEAIGRLEAALQAEDVAAVEAILDPDSSGRRPGAASELVRDYGGSYCRITSVTYTPTESGSFAFAAVSATNAQGTPFEFELSVRDVMSPGWVRTLGWHVWKS